MAGLDELLADPQVEIISLCSPRRADQARDAIRCLKAGKHVYAEKPAALTEWKLDEILTAAKESGREFHEADHLVTGKVMPLTLEEELHPLRMLLRAKERIRAEAAAMQKQDGTDWKRGGRRPCLPGLVEIR